MQFLSIAIFSVLYSVVQSESFRVCTLGPVGKEPANNCSFPVCTAQQRGLEVPAELCDDSLCQKAPLPDLTEVGKSYKYLKWNIMSETVGPKCPFIPALIESSPDSPNYPLISFTRASGINCSDVTKSIVCHTNTTDFFRGKLSILKYALSGEEWSMCRPYSVPGGPYIIRKCRTNPPSLPGKAFASIVLAIPADYSAESDADLQSFLGNYVVYWHTGTVNCI